MRSEHYRRLHRELNHTISMYASALLNGDKDSAKKFLETIKDLLDNLEIITNDLERAENKEEEYQALLSDIAEASETD